MAEHYQSCRLKKESENMSEATPTIEGAKKFRRSTRAAGPIIKKFVTKVQGLECHTFDTGNAKYATKYKETVDAIANHIQRECKGGADIAKAIKALSLPTLQVPEYPNAKAGEFLARKAKKVKSFRRLEGPA